ncbi:PREDICTED: protein PLASTID MOVEMENT IMPAIRED 2 isoform X2 [Nelumbo nucifera]|uniref:Protein PLASTID MOVEMENT IMPAIRED 2 isoform X2 n=1 Tax=Nelumbo nucifera TaxID=4432 RepID=A0A1U8BGR2_NELNU|nr:PREDICTED: protein PLASTID MOVEMENT IMPAIRED 2 isoform X2 [Nelumbo nucifera]
MGSENWLNNNIRGGMNRAEIDDIKRIGSVKAAVSLYGERFLERKPGLQKTQKLPSSAKELHLAKRDIGRLNESRKVAESEKAQAESELFNARKTVKDLTLQIEQSNSEAKAQKQEIEKLKKKERGENGLPLDVGEVDKHQYMEMMRELEFVKHELSRLKLDMASVKQAKLRAEKETEASVSRMRSYSCSVEALRKEIEDANEEQVLVELARIEAIKELEAIEAQRVAEATQFSDTIEKTRNRIKDFTKELDWEKKLETQLAITNADVDVLQNELKLVRAMESRVKQNENPGDTEVSEGREEQSETSMLLQSVTEEQEAAKKELMSIREEGYRFMSSMDAIRDEIKRVSKESAQLKSLEDKADLTVQSLNSKLLKAKSKMEAASAAEEKAKAIVSNLSITLQQLKTETDAAKKERELIREETACVQAAIQKTESQIDLAENRLEAAMQELEAVKASEATALESLKKLSEKTMRARAMASKRKSSITISKFEYEYLIGRAEEAKEVADKKVAAAEAWVEALKASEKEILIETEIAHNELKELQAKQETSRKDKSMEVERAAGTEHYDARQQSEINKDLQVEKALRRKSLKENGSSTPRRAKPRKPSSPGAWHVARSASITRRKRKAMRNMAKLFRRKRTDKDHLSACSNVLE